MELEKIERENLSQKFNSVSILFCSLAVPRSTLHQYKEGSHAGSMLITVFQQFPPKGHLESCNEVGSISLVRHPVRFEPGTFQF